MQVAYYYIDHPSLYISVTHRSSNKARLPHRLYFSKESSREKEQPNDEIPGRLHSTGFFRENRLPLYDLRVAQHNNVFFRKHNPCIYAPSPRHKSGKRRVCDIASACVLLLVPILLARVQTMPMCPSSCNTTLEARDAATRVAAEWLSMAQQSSSLPPRLNRSCPCRVYRCTFLPTEVQ